MKTKLLIYLLIITNLVGLASATCQTGWDYCANKTVWVTSEPGTEVWYEIDLYDLEAGYWTPMGGTEGWTCNSANLCRNIEGDAYVPDVLGGSHGDYKGNKSRVYVNITTVAGGPTVGVFLANSTNGLFNTMDDKLIASINVNDPTKMYVYVQVCLNGSDVNYGYLRNDNATTINITFLDNDFTAYYRRNWTFKDEVTNGFYNFTGKNTTLTVYCNGLSSFAYNLTNYGFGQSLTVQTTNKPDYSLIIQGAERTRTDSDHFLKDDFYLLNGGLVYPFNLVDYSGRCNGNLVFKKTLNDIDEIMVSTKFGLQRDAYAYLLNDSYYGVSIACTDGSVRDFGSIKMPYSNAAQNIEVTNINIANGGQQYSGGLLAKFTSYPSRGIVTLDYTKTSGLIDKVNFTVYNITDYRVLYNTYTTNTPNGSFNFNAPTTNESYICHYDIINSGVSLSKDEVCYFLNDTVTNSTQCGYLIGCNLPASWLGVSRDTWFLDFVHIGALVLAVSAAAIDSGFIILGLLAWYLIFDLLKWITIDSWLKVILAFIGLGNFWFLARRHDE